MRCVRNALSTCFVMFHVCKAQASHYFRGYTRRRPVFPLAFPVTHVLSMRSAVHVVVIKNIAVLHS